MTTEIPASQARTRRIFTFGHGQPNFPGYVIAYGATAADCRDLMYFRYGQKWSMEYQDEEAAGVKKWNLRLVATLGAPAMTDGSAP